MCQFGVCDAFLKLSNQSSSRTTVISPETDIITGEAICNQAQLDCLGTANSWDSLGGELVCVPHGQNTNIFHGFLNHKVKKAESE